MKEHERKSDVYIKSFNIGWRRNEEYEKGYDRIFRKEEGEAIAIDHQEINEQ